MNPYRTTYLLTPDSKSVRSWKKVWLRFYIHTLGNTFRKRYRRCVFCKRANLVTVMHHINALDNGFWCCYQDGKYQLTGSRIGNDIHYNVCVVRNSIEKNWKKK